MLFAGSLLGCEERSQTPSGHPEFARQIIAIRYSDASESQPTATEHFGIGEVPTIMIQGYGGETIYFHLSELSTGKVIRRQKRYIKKDRPLYWPFPDLSEGSYSIVFKITGMAQKKSLTFTVSR